ncbi:MAG: hypothetical protein JWR82_2677 [Blastococcus sp.]|jgi:hypothetical protein|nr:hypothetical protein [Blastococcus sp.]
MSHQRFEVGPVPDRIDGPTTIHAVAARPASAGRLSVG